MGCILLPGRSLPIPGLAYLELILGITENRDVLIKFLSWKKITQNTICFSKFLGEKGIESFFYFICCSFTDVTTLFLVQPERESLLNLWSSV